MKKLLLFCLLMASGSSFAAAKFQLYDAVPYGEAFGKPIKVAYPNQFITAAGAIDTAKINATPVTTEIMTVDNEFEEWGWRRFRPETVIPKTLGAIKAFRLKNPKTKIGVYATIPQNIYGWQKANEQTGGLAGYASLNDKYSSVTKHVDFLSPVMYNYFTDYYPYWWDKSATWLIAESKRLAPSKPIIPYISVEYLIEQGDAEKKIPSVIRLLTPPQLKHRIDFLKAHGCAGAIIWARSGVVLENGMKPNFDIYSGLLGFTPSTAK